MGYLTSRDRHFFFHSLALTACKLGYYSLDNGGSGHGDEVTNAKVKCVCGTSVPPCIHLFWSVAYPQGQLYLLPSELSGGGAFWLNEYIVTGVF